MNKEYINYPKGDINYPESDINYPESEINKYKRKFLHIDSPKNSTKQKK